MIVIKANQKFRNFINDVKGQFAVSGAVVGGLIVFAIAIYVAAAILPGAIDQFSNASTDNWDTGTVALWAVVPLVVVAGLLLLILRITGVVGGGRGEG